MLVIGGLIAVASLVGTAIVASGESLTPEMILLIFAIGSVPAAAGAALIFAAFKVRPREGAIPEGAGGPPRWTGPSIALFAIGLLILAPSGLCTGLGLLFTLADLSAAGIVLTVGGIPIALGAALVYAGLKLRRADD
jgi:hypothetical protein